MSQLHKNAKGFTVVEILLALIFITLIGLAGLYVAHNHSSTKQSATTAAKAPDSTAAATSTNKTTTPTPTLLTYTDSVGKFSVKYPDTWKLNADDGTLTSPTGTILDVTATSGGGIGGACEPGDGDVPFKLGNTCPTVEYLSSEKMAVSNTHYSPVYLVTSKFGDTDGKIQYMIGAETGHISLNKPQMGFILSRDDVLPVDDGNYPDISIYASDSAQSFLTGPDATTIKQIIRTLTINI